MASKVLLVLFLPTAFLLGQYTPAPAGSATWGSITGTLSSQTDLASALSGKQATLTNYSTISGLTGYPSTFPPINSGDWAGTWQTHAPAYFQTVISGAPGTWPSFAAVATSGSYADLTNKPTIPGYPASGIANSTGSAWGTSYSTSGSGTVLALTNSPTLVTPNLGVPSALTLTNATGLPWSSHVAATGNLSLANGSYTTTFTGGLWSLPVLSIPSMAVSGATGYGLQVTAPTGATANYAASFMGGPVGIGTTGPLAKLTIGGSSADPLGGLSITTPTGAGYDWRIYGSSVGAIQNGGGTGAGVHIGANTAGTEFWIGGYGNVVAHSFQSPNSATAATVVAIRGVTGQTGDYLQIRSTRSATNGDLLTVNNLGNVGIGTTSPIYGLDVATSGSGGTARIYDPRGSIGSTLLTVQAGAGQSGNLTTWNNNSGTSIASVGSDGTVKATNLQGAEVAVASLPTCNSTAAGTHASVNNSNAAFTAGIGAVVAAGGSSHVPVYCDGTNWRIG